MSKLLTVSEVSALLDIREKTIRKWISDGKLSGIKLPNREWRFKEENIAGWLDKRTVKARTF